eukprot:CAMPEP_0195083860 /NCGR_PEP_ID=MMETSP0448-20130528/24690_1 /TAXON_ID=66468 /ORGANISM="Heterocapsa triquestra, Strain CCMP 448" /LENGTH=229 /DNA_ID=CAMNT_0040117113 /DNA_START=24 /DNA_END=711 /DNA_ORIENTATION=+
MIVVETTAKKDLIDIKLQKAEVWKYLREAGIQKCRQVVYIDEDILIGQPIQKFLDVLNQPDNVDQAVIMFKNPNAETNFPHGGLMVSRRGPKAADCLSQWAHEMVDQRAKRKPRWEYDQPALNRTLCRQSGHIHILPTGWEGGLFAWPQPDELKAHKRAVFIHFTNNKKMHRADLWKPIKTYFTKDLGLVGDPHEKAKCAKESEGDEHVPGKAAEARAAHSPEASRRPG